jgi:trehalose-6-phosphate synthase
MPLEERLARWRPMFAYLQEHDINRWAEDFLSGLLDTRQTGGLRDSIWRLLSGSAAAAITAWISAPK